MYIPTLPMADMAKNDIKIKQVCCSLENRMLDFRYRRFKWESFMSFDF